MYKCTIVVQMDASYNISAASNRAITILLLMDISGKPE